MAVQFENQETEQVTSHEGAIDLTPVMDVSITPEEEVSYLRIMASDPQLALQVEDIPLIESRKRELDTTNMNSITNYGLDLKKRMSDLSQMMFENFNDSDEEAVDDALSQMVAYLGNVDFNEEQKRSVLFWRRKSQQMTVREKYDAVSKNVEHVGKVLEEHQVRLLKDCALLDQVFFMNKEYYHQLNVLIVGAKKKVEELRYQSFSYDPNMPTAQSENAWESSVIDLIERKIVELELSRSIALQQSAQIRMLQSNSAIMADKLQSTLYNTIPLWKNQIVLALGAEHAKQAVRTNKQITDMTNKLLVDNANRLKMVTAETHREAGNNFVDTKAIEASNRALAESLDEVVKIQSERRMDRILAEQELARIDTTLQNGM